MSSTLSAPARAEQAQRIAEDPDRVALMSAMTATASRQATNRQVGLRNDFTEFADISPLSLAGITCPVLVVHGTADKDVATSNATYAGASIPSCVLHWIPDGSHFGFLVSDDAQTHQSYVLDWLLTHRNRWTRGDSGRNDERGSAWPRERDGVTNPWGSLLGLIAWNQLVRPVTTPRRVADDARHKRRLLARGADTDRLSWPNVAGLVVCRSVRARPETTIVLSDPVTEPGYAAKSMHSRTHTRRPRRGSYDLPE